MCNKRPKDRKLDEGRIFNTDPHSSKWYWAIWQKRTGCSSKNCHISDLYSTNCTQEIKKGRTKSGKPCGKCGIPQAKQALKLDFWTFSTGFSTCGKIIALLRIVYRVFVENFFLRQNRGISTQQPGKADAGRQNISAKKRKRSPAPRTEKLLQDADKKR